MKKAAHETQPPEKAVMISKLLSARKIYTKTLTNHAKRRAVHTALKFEWELIQAKGLAFKVRETEAMLEMNRLKSVHGSLLRRISNLESELFHLLAESQVAKINYECALLIATSFAGEL
jgi:hypothetical protein